MGEARPLLVLVTGPPGTGKTTLGRRLATDLGLPFLAKDAIKESLFDTLGIGDVAWSRRLGAATMELLYLWMSTALTAGHSILVDCNFHPEQATPRLRALQAESGCRVYQVQCRAAGPVLAARYLARATSGARHPGHVDVARLDDAALVAQLQQGAYPDLPLAGPIVHVDTTDFAAVDYPALRAGLAAALAPRAP